MLFASGSQDKEGTEGTSSGAGTAEGWQDLKLGYYNLGDYGAMSGQQITSFIEAPMLAEMVRSGKLPPVAERS